MFPNKLTLGITQNVMNFEKYEEILRIEILVCWFPMEEVWNLNQHTHQCTIHWMPVIAQLWMNLKGVNLWFHPCNQFNRSHI